MARVTMLLDNDFTHDNRVKKEARSLTGAGHEVRVVALRTGDAAAREEVEGVEVIRVPPPSWTGLRGPLHLVPLLLWYRRMGVLGREAERHPADVVHAHDLTTLGPARRAARRLGAALVFDDHELYVETLNTTWPTDAGPLRSALHRAMAGHLRRRGTALERRWLRGLDGHIVVSDSIADEVVRRYGVPRPVLVANCRPFTEPVAPDGRLRAALDLPGDARIVLYVGSIPGSGRGLADLVDAVPLLPEDVRLVFIGPGWGRERLRARAAERGVGERVSFLPAVPAEEVPRWLSCADVSAIPNRPVNLSNAFALPNKLFESMMAPVPVVAAGTVEIRRVLTEFPAGVLYEPGDSKDLAARIAEVLGASDKTREEWRAAARRAVTGPWCWERQEERLIDLYDRILRARG